MKRIHALTILLVLALAPLWAGCASLESSSDMTALSDDAIVSDAADRIRNETRVPVQVTASGGVVTVSGVIADPGVKARVLNAARGTPGVKSVVDDIRRY